MEDMQRQEHQRLLANSKSHAQRKMKGMRQIDEQIIGKTGGALELKDVALAERMYGRFGAEARMEMSEQARAEKLQQSMDKYEEKVIKSRLNKLTRLQAQDQCIIIIQDPLLSSAIMRAFLGTSGNTDEYLDHYLQEKFKKYNVIHNPLNDSQIYNLEDSTPVPIAFQNPIDHGGDFVTTETDDNSTKLKMSRGHLLDRELVKKLNQNWLEFEAPEMMLPPHQRTKNTSPADIDPNVSMLYSEIRPLLKYNADDQNFHPYESPAVPEDPLALNILHNIKLSDYEIVNTTWDGTVSDRIDLVDTIPPFFLPLLTQYNNELNTVALPFSGNSPLKEHDYINAVRLQFGFDLTSHELAQVQHFKKTHSHQFSNTIQDFLPPSVLELISRDNAIFEPFLDKVHRWKRKKIEKIKQLKNAQASKLTPSFLSGIDELENDDWNIDVDDLLEHHLSEMSQQGRYTGQYDDNFDLTDLGRLDDDAASEFDPTSVNDDIKYDLGYMFLNSPIVASLTDELYWIQRTIFGKKGMKQIQNQFDQLSARLSPFANKKSPPVQYPTRTTPKQQFELIQQDRIDDFQHSTSFIANPTSSQADINRLLDASFNRDQDRDHMFRVVQEAHMLGILDDEKQDEDYGVVDNGVLKGKQLHELEHLALNSTDPMIRLQAKKKLAQNVQRKGAFDEENSNRILKHGTLKLDQELSGDLSKEIINLEEEEENSAQLRQKYGIIPSHGFDHQYYLAREEMKKDFEEEYPGVIEKRKKLDQRRQNDSGKVELSSFEHGNPFYRPPISSQDKKAKRAYDINEEEGEYLMTNPLHVDPSSRQSLHTQGDDYEYGQSIKKPTDLDDDFQKTRREKVNKKLKKHFPNAYSRSKIQDRTQIQNQLAHSMNRSLQEAEELAKKEFLSSLHDKEVRNQRGLEDDVRYQLIRDEEKRRERIEYKRRKALVRNSEIQKRQQLKAQRARRNSSDPTTEEEEEEEEGDGDQDEEHWYDDAELYEDDDDDDDDDDDELHRGYYKPKPAPKTRRQIQKDLYKKKYAQAPQIFGNEDALLTKTLHYLGKSVQNNIRSGLLAALQPQTSNQIDFQQFKNQKDATRWIQKQLSNSHNEQARRFLRSLNSGVLTSEEAGFISEHGLVGAVNLLTQTEQDDEMDDIYDLKENYSQKDPNNKYRRSGGGSGISTESDKYRANQLRSLEFELDLADEWNEFERIQKMKMLDLPFIDEVVSKDHGSTDDYSNHFDTFSRGGSLYNSEALNTAKKRDVFSKADHSYYREHGSDLSHLRQEELLNQQRFRAKAQEKERKQQRQKAMSQRDQQQQYQRQQQGGIDLSQLDSEQQQHLFEMAAQLLEQNGVDLDSLPTDQQGDVIQIAVSTILEALGQNQGQSQGQQQQHQQQHQQRRPPVQMSRARQQPNRQRLQRQQQQQRLMEQLYEDDDYDNDYDDDYDDDYEEGDDDGDFY